MELLDNKDVEGLLFGYKHFWGDYNHYHQSHGWYPYEIRIVRNHPNIHSWQSAQSFRWYDNYESTHQEAGTRKLKVAIANAEIYHYGWVRPPHYMQSKSKALDSVHKGKEAMDNAYKEKPREFDYGPLDRLRVFKDSHPAVMQEMISRMNWKDKLQYSGQPDPARKLHKHERMKYRIISSLERTLFGGKQMGRFPKL